MVSSAPTIAESSFNRRFSNHPTATIQPVLVPGVPQKPTAPRKFVGRSSQLMALDMAIGPQQLGAVLVGPGGIGKTAVVHACLAQRPAQLSSHYLRGTDLTSDTPYGILSFLLSAVGGTRTVEPSLAEVLRVLTAGFRAEASYGLPLVVVDDADRVDPWSAMALAELRRMGSIRLILICRRVNGLPAEFSGMWRTGQLLRIDMPPMGADDVHALLIQELSGPCSIAAASLLLKTSGGNPMYLKALIRQATSDGALVKTDGIWVWREGQPFSSISLGPAQLGRLVNAASGNVEILNLVAVARGLPIAALTELYSAGAIDELLESSDLRYAGSGKSSVVVGHSVLAKVLPEFVSKDQNQLWFSAVEAIDPIDQLRGEARRQREEWAQLCGVSVVNHPDNHRAAGPAAIAHWLSPEHWRPLLQPVIEGSSGLVSHADVRYLTGEQAQWLAQQAEILAMTGRQDYAMVLAKALTARLDLSPQQSARSEPRAPIPAALVGPLQRIHMAAGEWGETVELMAACHERGVDSELSEAVQIEVASALMLAFTGHSNESVSVFSQVIAQLKHLDLPEWATLSHIAKVATLLAQDPGAPYQVREAADSLNVMGTPADGGQWARLADEFLTIADNAKIPPLLRTIVQCLLLEIMPTPTRITEAKLRGARPNSPLADEAGETIVTLPLQRMLCLAAEVDGSNAGLCDELLTIATTQEGALAETYGLYAKGLLAHDSNVLVQTVECTRVNGFPRFSAKAAAAALRFAPPDGIRSIRRQLQRLVQLPADLSEPASELNARLTEREEAVGVLAANGASNKEIAEQMGVSVRTIEGHLYQVYAKLQVASRVDLAPLLSGPTDG